MNAWIENLDPTSNRYEHHLLEALWVSWGINQVGEDLLIRLLNAEDFRARAGAVRVLRYNPQLSVQKEMLAKAAEDSHGRVLAEVMTAASWLDPEHGLPIVEKASQSVLDKWNMNVSVTSLAHLKGISVPSIQIEEETPDLAES